MDSTQILMAVAAIILVYFLFMPSNIIFVDNRDTSAMVDEDYDVQAAGDSLVSLGEGNLATDGTAVENMIQKGVEAFGDQLGDYFSGSEDEGNGIGVADAGLMAKKVDEFEKKQRLNFLSLTENDVSPMLMPKAE